MLLKQSSISTTIITISTLLVTSTVAQAKEIKNHDDLRSYCSQAVSQYNIKDLDCNNSTTVLKLENNVLSAKRDAFTLVRRQTRRTSKSYGVKGYIGISPGLFFPNLDLNTGFGGGIYGGIRFNKNFAADIELNAFGGEVEDSILTYGVFAGFINPRFIFPFSEREKSLAIYISPGIGFSGIGAVSQEDIAAARTHFAWQVKSGIAFPFSSKLSGFGQVKYINQTGDSTVDFLGTELGLNFEF